VGAENRRSRRRFSLNIIDLPWNRGGGFPVEIAGETFKFGGCHGELDERKIV
jgi:hypothetical protein